MSTRTKSKRAKKTGKQDKKPPTAAQPAGGTAVGKHKEERPVKRVVLGRGLEALLGEEAHTAPAAARPAAAGATIEDLPIEKIGLNPYQPRTQFDEAALAELAKSIEVHGIIQPITVRRFGETGGYQLISGERRLQAMKRLGRSHVPAYVRSAEDAQLLEMALIENIQRESLNAIEIALSYRRLIDECAILQEEAARRVGKERSTVTNYLRLLRLPPDIQAALRDNRISMGHARSLLSIEDPAAQLVLLGEVLKKQLSVRQTETAVRQLRARRSQRKEATPEPMAESTRALLGRLQAHLHTKVALHARRGETGELRLAYYNEDDLQRLLDLLCP